MTDKDTSKLPRWARDEIQKLRADFANSEDKVRKLTGEEPSRVQVDPYAIHMSGTVRYLRDHDTVRFYLGDDRRHYIDVRFEERNNTIKLQGSRGPLAVYPQSSNVAAVGFGEK